ncbi:hypothetical protein [Rhizobium sp. NXC24]|uniref:hypothetical protein n=1 Tax=Rhizobium sp. NXC24 TaxID=2048897 RepID=UPI000CDF485B|nr:hypothetical protein [Rhizobium sp. NXC24]AVA21590.1 hypothetical protein NXC24_CH01951 [Rhizobium sp. NXC24]
MKTQEDEIKRITYTLKNLEAYPDPSPEMRELVTYYKYKLLTIERKPESHFRLIGDQRRALILDDADGDVA